METAVVGSQSRLRVGWVGVRISEPERRKSLSALRSCSPLVPLCCCLVPSSFVPLARYLYPSTLAVLLLGGHSIMMALQARQRRPTIALAVLVLVAVVALSSGVDAACSISRKTVPP